VTGRQRSWWGWGWTDQALDDEECAALAAGLPGLADTPRRVPSLADLRLPGPRVAAPSSLARCGSEVPEERIRHTYGKAYRDVVRALSGDVAAAPDLVARPRSEREVVDVLDWGSSAGIAVIPFGGGSSVVGGVEYRGHEHAGVISLDLTGLDQVLEVDRVSRAARIQAGVLGPALEDQLRPHGLTLRHFPQSFEFSTLGGWLATRAGGHSATGRTHIDDFVESLQVVTPAGTGASWRLPASGAGPSPDRLFLGSEGVLGVITEAWLRVQERPRHRASAAVAFDDFDAGLPAVRALAQSDLAPANCRLLDPGEAAMSGAAADGSAVLVLGFESATGPVDDRLALALDLGRAHGGRGPGTGRTGAAPRPAVPSAPGGRRSCACPTCATAWPGMGAVAETFETATTWDRLRSWSTPSAPTSAPPRASSPATSRRSTAA
jgi:alkyldihydroxyacetonephosphate synthase